MKSTDLEALRHLCRAYGQAEVVRELMNVTNEACEKDYTDNPNAIIHQYAPVIAEAFSKIAMVRMNRFIKAPQLIKSLTEGNASEDAE